MDSFVSVQASCLAAIRTARRGETLAGMKMAQSAWRDARKGGDPRSQLYALNALANCQAVHNDFIEAVASAIDAYEMAVKQGDEVAQVFALTTLAGASGFTLNTFDATLSTLAECRQRAEKMGDMHLKRRIGNIRGVMLGNLRRFEEAEREFEWVRTHADDTDYNTPITLVWGNHAHCAVKRARAAEGAEQTEWLGISEQRTEETLALAMESANKDTQSRMMFNRGEINTIRLDWPAAVTAYAQGLALARELRQRIRIVDNLVELGRAQMGAGELQQALETFGAAYAEADFMRPTPRSAQAADCLAEAMQALGRPDEAQHQRTVAEREREQFERESAHVRDALLAFWRDHPAETVNAL